MTIKMRMHKLVLGTAVNVKINGSYEDMVYVMDLLTSKNHGNKCKVLNVNFNLKTFVIDNYHNSIDKVLELYDIIPDGEVYEDDYTIKWKYKAI